MLGRTLVLAAVLLAGEKERPRTVHLDLREFLEADDPSVVIKVVSIDASLGHALDPEELDERIEDRGPDYTFIVHDLGKARALARRLMAVTLEETGEAQAADVRYRIEFMDGDDAVTTVHVSIFGDVVHDETLYEPTLDRGWLTAFWKDVEKHFVAVAR